MTCVKHLFQSIQENICFETAVKLMLDFKLSKHLSVWHTLLYMLNIIVQSDFLSFTMRDTKY